jgi:hypothetical protein
LQIERRRLHGHLLLAGQAGQTVCEGIGDAESMSVLRLTD